jgi:hypothetical protein
VQLSPLPQTYSAPNIRLFATPRRVLYFRLFDLVWAAEENRAAVRSISILTNFPVALGSHEISPPASIGGNCPRGLGGDIEQQAIDHCLVGAGEVARTIE